jgi:hypothetical protein
MEEKFNVTQAVTEAAAKFREEYAAKSFSGRHPELGKMVKCQICLRRHRSIIKCEQVFAVGTHDPAPEGEKTLLIVAQTRKGILGAAAFAKKRIRPHINKRGLLLIERTRVLFEKHLRRFSHPQDAMMSAREEALFQLRVEYAVRRGVLAQQQQRSRQINQGLIPRGTR